MATMKRVRVDDAVAEVLDRVTDEANSIKSATASESLLLGLEEYAELRGLDWDEIIDSCDGVDPDGHSE